MSQKKTFVISYTFHLDTKTKWVQQIISQKETDEIVTKTIHRIIRK